MSEATLVVTDEKFLCDLRAEVLVAEAIERAKSLGKSRVESDFLFKSQSMFKRGYRPDAQLIRPDKDFDSDRLKTDVVINRDGLYDHLPQNLFHRTRLPRNTQTDILVKEEENARRFFLPFEQEFYALALETEQYERDFMQGYGGKGAAEQFLQFWDLDSCQDIKSDKFITLLYVLPFASAFAGDFDRCADCFSAVLGMPVSIVKSAPRTVIIPSQFMPVLDQAALGVDFVLSETLKEEIPSLDILIGPLPRDEILNFLPNCSGIKLIELLCGFLIPAGMDTTLTCILAEEDSMFTMSEESFTARLGLTTILT